MFFQFNLITLIFFTYVSGNCNNTRECREPTLIYDSLKCEPIYTSSHNNCCPSSYECPLFEKSSLNKGKCIFRGKFYSQGETINDEEVFGSCRVGCSCGQLNSGQMGFSCAYLDCPRIQIENKPGCHMKYDLDKCCSTDIVCPPFSVKCEVNGNVYNDGELFEVPYDKCTKCVCQKGFNGKYEAPFCKKQECLDEVGYQTKIMNFCAPSYISKNDCCPFTWICPEDSDTIMFKNNSKDTNLKCRFGEETLNIGDSFERKASGGKLMCECKIPPFMTCIQDYQYPRSSGDY